MQIQLQQALREKSQLQDRVNQLSKELQLQASESVESPPKWKNLSGHQFSAEMICLCCQLSSLIGLRAVPKVLALVANAFELSIEVPSRDAVRNWSCRNGVAILQEPCKEDDWIWMIDHSVQLGKMFVLVVLGIRQSELPSGRALRRQDMTPLAVLPTKSRDKETVAEQLANTAELFGTPLAVLSDGAAELHEGVRRLESVGFSGPHVDDIKHKAANLLKKRFRNDERWKAFSAKLGTTTASIQQTELEHLLPPRKKEKARFMNFGRLIDWTKMIEHQLTQVADPNHERIVEKLGWIAEFQADLALWSEYRCLISEALKMANVEGVFMGASELLRKRLLRCDVQTHLACEFGGQLLSLYQHNEAQLAKLGRDHIRLPSSTEVLESGFGGFKALQGNHGRGTFTSFLAVFATQFEELTASKIRERFAQVLNKDVKSWLNSSGLTDSTQSRRTRAYAQSRTPVTVSTA